MFFKSKNKLKEAVRKSDKKALTVYVILRTAVIVCLINELIHGNYENAFLCVFSLILFLMPTLLEKTLKIEFPSVFESIVYIFIFAAEILGEINNFYSIFANFDTILHTINGFLCASLGFSLVYILNENVDSINLSPLFVSLVAFCFSMTIGVMWEFYEYGIDKTLHRDMQKDQIVDNINTVTLDETNSNKVIKIKGIDYTIIYDEDGKELVKLDGYLDIGLHDTMKDLVVNFIGALVYSVFGYLYIINKDKYRIAGKFLTKKRS
ncbi:MAG: MFS transporter [Firmicutes bacterium]|nr:MFS transporter [Bacillota bacterium]